MTRESVCLIRQQLPTNRLRFSSRDRMTIPSEDQYVGSPRLPGGSTYERDNSETDEHDSSSRDT
jgi:hypothetical protein